MPIETHVRAFLKTLEISQLQFLTKPKKNYSNCEILFFRILIMQTSQILNLSFFMCLFYFAKVMKLSLIFRTLYKFTLFQNLINISGKQKRVRMTSTSSLEEIKPFENLQSLDIYLKSPTHMPIFQLLVSLSKNLESLIFDQFYCDYEESLINRTLFEWNSLKTLKNLIIGSGSFNKTPCLLRLPLRPPFRYNTPFLDLGLRRGLIPEGGLKGSLRRGLIK